MFVALMERLSKCVRRPRPDTFEELRKFAPVMFFGAVRSTVLRHCIEWQDALMGNASSRISV